MELAEVLPVKDHPPQDLDLVRLEGHVGVVHPGGQAQNAQLAWWKSLGVAQGVVVVPQIRAPAKGAPFLCDAALIPRLEPVEVENRLRGES